MAELNIPLDENQVSKLGLLDVVRLNGVMVTARDAAHKFLVDSFIDSGPGPADKALYDKVKGLLAGGAVYHCGPVVAKENGRWRVLAAGPTTSTREEPYEHKIIGHFGVRAVVGKGGMGPKTLEALRKHKAVYLHAVGGAATLIADSIVEVVDVLLEDLGTPEAMWVIRVKDFPAVVTMDSQGRSVHEKVLSESGGNLRKLLGLKGGA